MPRIPARWLKRRSCRRLERRAPARPGGRGIPRRPPCVGRFDRCTCCGRVRPRCSFGAGSSRPTGRALGPLAAAGRGLAPGRSRSTAPGAGPSCGRAGWPGCCSSSIRPAPRPAAVGWPRVLTPSPGPSGRRDQPDRRPARGDPPASRASPTPTSRRGRRPGSSSTGCVARTSAPDVCRRAFDLVLTSETLEHVPDLARPWRRSPGSSLRGAARVHGALLPGVAATFARAAVGPTAAIRHLATPISVTPAGTSATRSSPSSAPTCLDPRAAGFESRVDFGPTTEDDLARSTSAETRRCFVSRRPPSFGYLPCSTAPSSSSTSTPSAISSTPTGPCSSPARRRSWPTWPG